METDFSPAPHREAVALLTGKPVMVKRVFNQLLPELKARAFTVAGIESANCMQRIRDAVASVPLGGKEGMTWDEAKKSIADELESFLGDGADRRAELVLRVNTFQAYSASIHEAGMADDDTTHFQYLHGECEVPTPSHLALNGVVLPKDDPFWETHTGPWGHLGCVCYKRPMNPDQVAEEQQKDEKRNPENKMVL
ncbi:MAG: phage minor head protein, partial [Verrucomicrobiota bacterium]